MIDALACWRLRLDAVAASAVAAFVAVNPVDAAILASLRRLSRRAAASDVPSAVVLVAALSGMPAAQAQAFADLAALVNDASALAKVPVASLPHLLAALLGAERYEAVPTETHQLGLRFISALHASHGIPNDIVAAALIAHAGRVACGDTDDALVSLARACWQAAGGVHRAWQACHEFAVTVGAQWARAPGSQRTPQTRMQMSRAALSVRVPTSNGCSTQSSVRVLNAPAHTWESAGKTSLRRVCASWQRIE